MSLTYLVDRVRGRAPGSKVETVTFGGQTFTAGRRTIAHLLWTQDQLTAKHPGCVIRVLQPCYHQGYPPSAGTHDGDGVLDIEIVGDMGAATTEGHWEAAEGFMRAHGWDGWWRHTGSWAAESEWHIHMISDGCPGPVGYLIPSQVADYRAHRDGLAGHAADDTWHPATPQRFDYAAYRAAQKPAKKATRKAKRARK